MAAEPSIEPSNEPSVDSSSESTDVVEAAQATGLDIPALLDRVEDVLLGGPRKFTADEVAAAADQPRDKTRALWRALGFATVDDGAAVFTDCDVEALGWVRELQACGFEDDALVAAMTRLFGQTFSRLASWQGQLLAEVLAPRPELLQSRDPGIEGAPRGPPLLPPPPPHALRP